MGQILRAKHRSFKLFVHGEAIILMRIIVNWILSIMTKFSICNISNANRQGAIAPMLYILIIYMSFVTSLLLTKSNFMLLISYFFSFDVFHKHTLNTSRQKAIVFYYLVIVVLRLLISRSFDVLCADFNLSLIS